QAADADRGGTRLLGRRVRRALQDPQVLSRRGGAGPVAGGQAARPRPAVLHRHPRALQRHHGAVELLPREGPRSPRLGAGRLATDLPREARGDADALVLDGGADDGADPRRVRRDLRSEEHTSELQSRFDLVCRLLLPLLLTSPLFPYTTLFRSLVLSNVITALSSFFLAKDLDLLVSAPVDWLRIYLAKLGETLMHSSWMVALMTVPILAAYGVI